MGSEPQTSPEANEPDGTMRRDDPLARTASASGKPPDVATSLLRVTGANVFPIPPPLYYAAAVGTGLLLHRLVPLKIPFRAIAVPTGAAVLAGGLAFNFAAVITVVTHKTTLVPHRRVATLITTGVYRVSRNPMYTGLALAVAGASLLARTWWPLILLPAALLAVRQLAIEPEERYLTEHFGSLYTDYQVRVRRWL